MASLRRTLPVLAVLGLGVLAAWPLLAHSGFLLTRGGGDSPFLLLRLSELVEGLKAGQFPIRWMPDAAYGYGYPFFSYYAALPYYGAALLHLTTSFVAALKLTQTAGLALGALGMYAWARSLGPPLTRPQAWLAAAAYTFAPFHLANLYVRGDSLSELWAMGLYPLALWRAQRLLAAPDLRRGLSLALCTGLLVLCHNISALNFMPFVALYLVLGSVRQGVRQRANEPIATSGGRSVERPYTFRRLIQSGWLRPLVAGGLALAAGLLLAAFFWAPALGETSAVQLADVTQGYFYYGNHFRGADLVQNTWLYNADTAPDMPSPFAMGLVQALLAAAGLAALLVKTLRARRWTATDSFSVLGLAVSTFMMTPASAWVWANAPLVHYTQFPWRFLSLQALFTAALTAHLVPTKWAGKWRPSAGVAMHGALAAGLGLALAWAGLGALRPEFVPLTDADVTPARLQLMEYFSANIGSTIGYEYLPRAVQPRPFASQAVLGRAPSVQALSGAATGERLSQTGAAEAWTITASEAATVAVPTYYWPGWQVRVDGAEVNARAAPGLGWIAFDVPAGAHAVRLALGRTPLRAAAEAVSALAWLALAAGTLRVMRRAGWPRPGWKAAAWVAGGAAVLVLGVAALRDLRPASADLPYSIDFAQLTYYHADRVRFAGGAQLVGLGYSADRLGRGGTLTIDSTWNAPTGVTVTFGLAPGSNLLSQAPVALTSVTSTLSGAALTLDLPIPSDIPPGVYFVTVQAADALGPLAALTPQGRMRGLVHLAPVWVDDPGPAAPSAAPLARFGSAIDLLAASATTPEPNVLQANLTWHAPATIPANHQIALRLRDAAGTLWAGQDMQLAYGMYPTSLWRADEVIPDFYRLALPAGTPPGEYVLDVNLYDSVTLAGLGNYALPVTVTAATPRAGRAAQHDLTDALALGAVTLPGVFDQGAAPEFSAEWLTSGAPAGDYRARWTLRGADGAGVSQTLDLAPGSPTSAWPADAYVLGRARFGTNAALQPGDYVVLVQLVDAAGQTVGPEVTVGVVTVRGRARSFDVPPLPTTVGATFGGVLTLHGYAAAQTPEALELTLAWGALAAPGHDYKFFVHLFNPADGFVLDQVDAMPRANAYPTALWVAGEVVTDTVRFDLSGLPPGRYGLAVGWYDPSQSALPRLPARDATGAALPGDQVVLPDEVVVP
ncbi:MAG: hypothetical protein IT317_03825 [Anaerolineales bacterium]|nr:hypothetical protein [Anaerolineales bacterium]